MGDRILMADRIFQHGTEAQFNTVEAAAKIREGIPEGGKPSTLGGKLNSDFMTMSVYKARVDPADATKRFWEICSDDTPAGGDVNQYNLAEALAAFTHAQLVAFQLENDKTDED